MITAYPSQVRADATSLLIFRGEPNVSVVWSLTGTGTLVPGANRTDETGQAHAIYTPGAVGDTVIIGVQHGT